MTSNSRRYFKIDRVYCGYSLYKCIGLIGYATMMISSIALGVSISFAWSQANESSYNTKPLVAIDMIFSLTCISVSVYQIIISALLVMMRKTYICSLWFVSHMSILILYLILFSARIAICIKLSMYCGAFFTILNCIIYEGIILFFMIVIDGYMFSIIDSEPRIVCK